MDRMMEEYAPEGVPWSKMNPQQRNFKQAYGAKCLRMKRRTRPAQPPTQRGFLEKYLKRKEGGFAERIQRGKEEAQVMRELAQCV